MPSPERCAGFYTPRMRSTSAFRLVPSRSWNRSVLSRGSPFVRRRHGRKRAAGMRLCQRRQPPKAVAAGQRLQGRILAATIGRGARGVALFKGNAAGSRSACSGRNLLGVVASVCTGDRVAKSKAGG
jgi:hypothetical protein